MIDLKLIKINLLVQALYKLKLKQREEEEENF